MPHPTVISIFVSRCEIRICRIGNVDVGLKSDREGGFDRGHLTGGKLPIFGVNQNTNYFQTCRLSGVSAILAEIFT